MRKPLSVLSFLFLVCACTDERGTGGDGAAGGGSAAGGASAGAGVSAGSSGDVGLGGAPMGGGGETSAGGAGTSAAGAGGASAGGAGAGGASLLGAAVSLNLLAPSTCSLPAEFIDYPKVPEGHPVTATTKGETLRHNGMTADGARVRVACMWAELGQALLFDGSIQIQGAGSTSAINLGATSITEGQPAEGGLVISGAVLPAQYGAPIESCTLTPIEIDRETNSIWGEIQCPTFESLDSDDVCEIGPSYFYFRNCPEM